jgi:hypothetical protein
VNVASTGSALLRVEPGQPNNSYLVEKIDPANPQRMPPPPAAPLPQAEIDAIVDWITDPTLP